MPSLRWPVLAALIAWSVIALGSDSSSAIQQTYTAAKKEGVVNLWGTNAEDLNWIRSEFPKSYPGIEVKVFTDLNIVSRAITEARAGRTSADVIWNSEALVVPLIERGLLARPQWSALNVPSEDTGANGYMALTSSMAYAFAFRTDGRLEHTLPERWIDISDTRYSGKIAASPLLMGRLIAAMGSIGNADEMISFARQLRDRSAVLWTNDLLERSIATGERPYVAAIPYYLVDRWKANGVPVDYVFPDPVFITQFGSVVTTDAPHPASARLLASWLASESGRKARREALFAVDLRPLSKDPKAAELRSQRREIVLDSDRLIETRNELIPRVDRVLAGY